MFTPYHSNGHNGRDKLARRQLNMRKIRGGQQSGFVEWDFNSSALQGATQ